MTPPKVPRFEINEKVFVNHGVLMYEGKVLEVDNSPRGVQYLVHYQGWNQRYDELVPEVKLQKYNEASTKKAKDLEEKNNPKSSKRKHAPGLSKDGRERSSSRASTPSLEGKPKATASGSTDSGEPKAKNFRLDPYVEPESQYISRPEIKVKIPEDLKPILVDDWDYITRQYKLVQLPPPRTVKQILGDYLSWKKCGNNSLSQHKLSQIEEIISGVGEYFNVMLGTQLLYKFERPQYAEWLQANPNQSPAEVYGSIHLLRLFVRLGYMLAYTRLTEKNVNLILTYVHDLLGYMLKHKDSLFSPGSDYMTANPEYQRNAFA